MKFVFILGCLVSCLGIGTSIDLSSKKCPPNVRGMKNFKPSKFLGVWYYQSAVPEYWGLVHPTCQRANFLKMRDGSIGYYMDDFLNTPLDFTGLQLLVAKRGLFRLTMSGKKNRRAELAWDYVVRPLDPFGLKRMELDYDPNTFIIDTDYKNWAVMYSCKELKGVFGHERLFLATRSPKCSESLRKFVIRRMFASGLPVHLMRKVDHSDCRRMPSVKSSEYRRQQAEVNELEVE